MVVVIIIIQYYWFFADYDVMTITCEELCNNEEHDDETEGVK